MTMHKPKTGIQTTIVPFLTVKNGADAAVFYTTGFGAVELVRYNQPDGRVTAKLSIEGAEFWMGDEELEFGNSSPDRIGGSPVRIILIVSDPATFFERAIAAGATQLCPVTTEEDWIIGKLQDPFGHTWEIGHPLKDEQE